MIYRTKVNWIAKFALNFTALSPVIFVFSLASYIVSQIEISITLALLNFLLISICLLIIWRVRKKGHARPFKIKSIEPVDSENAAMLLMYLIPLFSIDFENFSWVNWEVGISIFAIISIFGLIGLNYHYNPILLLLGWHFYKVDSEKGVKYLLITKKNLYECNVEVSVGTLTEYVLIDLEET